MRTVLKIGGSVLEPSPRPELAAAIVERVLAGDKLVIVHGGGKALTGLLSRLGINSQFRRGLRVTDDATLEAAVMVLAGVVNKKLVGSINAAGHGRRGFAGAVGFCGIDANCVRASILDRELGHVGEVDACDAALLETLLENDFVPVLASLASDGAGGALNVNADQFAAACARIIGASRAVFVTDVDGVLDRNGRVIPLITLDELERMAVDGSISSGMLPKMQACREALESGVAEVEIVGAAAALAISAWDAQDCPGTRVLPA